MLEIEKAVASGARRGMDGLLPASAGNLLGLITSLIQTRRPVIGIVTGFVIASADPPVAETDGPIGAALLVHLCRVLGWPVLVLTDDWCEPVLRPVLADAGLPDDQCFVARTREKSGTEENLERCREFLKAHEVTHLLSIERPGRSYDGSYRNMKGMDISGFVYGFDELFSSQEWVTAAFGDGGNEIGMGSVSRLMIARHVQFGEQVACSTPVDFNVVCGVSNWGAYALAAGLAALMPDRAGEIKDALGDELEQSLMQRALRAGAVDGASGKSAPSVDGIGQGAHLQKKHQLFGLLGARPD